MGMVVHGLVLLQQRANLTCLNLGGPAGVSGSGSDEEVRHQAHHEERQEGQRRLLLEQLGVQHCKVTYPARRQAMHHRIYTGYTHRQRDRQTDR